MGAWGVGNFENDQAHDWVNDFLNNPGREPLEEVFNYVLDQRDFLDSPESCVALAAAELVAAKAGHPSEEFLKTVEPETVLDFAVDAALKELAARAVGQILYQLGHSELRELWQEAGAPDYAEWVVVVSDLRQRLLYIQAD